MAKTCTRGLLRASPSECLTSPPSSPRPLETPSTTAFFSSASVDLDTTSTRRPRPRPSYSTSSRPSTSLWLRRFRPARRHQALVMSLLAPIGPRARLRPRPRYSTTSRPSFKFVAAQVSTSTTPSTSHVPRCDALQPRPCWAQSPELGDRLDACRIRILLASARACLRPPPRGPLDHRPILDYKQCLGY